MELTELASRALRDGSSTIIRLLWDGADRFVVEAENVNGRCTTSVTGADAYTAYAHPFSRTEWLSYPGEDADLLGNAPEAFLAHAADMAEIDHA